MRHIIFFGEIMSMYVFFLHFSNERTVESCMQGECINYAEAGYKYCFNINSKLVYDTLDIPVSQADDWQYVTEDCLDMTFFCGAGNVFIIYVFFGFE